MDSVTGQCIASKNFDEFAVFMKNRLSELESDFSFIKQSMLDKSSLDVIAYRALERCVQLLIEACIGITKQTLKSQQMNVPSEAREAFNKLKSLGLDGSDIPWSKVVGMRNALVHDYLNLDKERIIEVITQNHYVSLLNFANQLLK